MKKMWIKSTAVICAAASTDWTYDISMKNDKDDEVTEETAEFLSTLEKGSPYEELVNLNRT